MGQVLSATWTPTPTPCCVGFPFGINIFPFTVTATTISGNHTNTEPIFICLSIKMPLNCSSLVTQRPFIRTTRRLLTPHHGKFHTFSFLFNCQHITRNTQYKNKTPHSVSLSKFDTNYSVSSSIMEEQQQGNLSLDKSLEAKYSEELDVAVRAVQMACFLCQKVQENLISKSSNQVHSKDDNSPVTVAGLSHYSFPVSIIFSCCVLNWVFVVVLVAVCNGIVLVQNCSLWLVQYCFIELLLLSISS